MKGKNELKELETIANSEINNAETLCGSCSNFPLNKDTDAANMICPFRNVVNSATNWKSLGCKYFWK